MNIVTRLTQIGAQLIFWISMSLLWAVINGQEKSMYLYVFCVVALVVLTYLVRLTESKKTIAALHVIFLIAFLCIFVVYPTRERVILILALLYLILSWIAGHKELDFMDRGHGLQFGFLFLSCFIQYVMGKNTIYALGLSFFFVFLYFLQRAFEKNDNFMYFNGKSVKADHGKILLHGGFYSVVLLIGITLFALAVSAIGLLPVFQKMEQGIKSMAYDVVNLIQNPVPKNKWYDEPKPVNTTTGGNSAESGDIPPFFEVVGVIAFVLTWVALLTALGMHIYKKRKNKVAGEEEDQRETVQEEKKLRITRRMRKLQDPSYSERMKIRKIYYKRMKNKGNSLILNPKTPMEHKALKEKNQEFVEQTFIDIYEQARYSKGTIKREDIKNMQEHK